MKGRYMAEQYAQQRYLIYFILSVMVLISSAVVAVGIDSQAQKGSVQAYASVSDMSCLEKKENYVEYASSKPRVVEYHVLIEDEETAGGQAEVMNRSGILLDENEYEILCRIVQAEAGCEDIKGKILVANVVLNRVADERFPDSVSGVVFQYSGNTAQFSPVSDGSYYRVCVSSETIEAVNRALAGEDYSEGALYFAARNLSGSQKMQWFDRCLTKLFEYGGHEFFM